MPVERTKHIEEGSAYYDRIYSAPGGYDAERFTPIYDIVMKWLGQCHDVKVIECGSGTGVLAARILAASWDYYGFDFSPEAIRLSPDEVKPHVMVDNAYDPESWCERFFNTVIAIETFEHLDDLRVLEFIEPRKRVIFSVPDFSSMSHLRTYPDLESIAWYYRHYLHIEKSAVHIHNGKMITVCDSIRI